MTKRKLNNLIKFLICIAPFISLFMAFWGYAKAYEGTGSFNYGTFGNIVYNNFAQWFKPISIFDDLNTLFTNTFGISGNNTMIGWFTIYYIEYLIVVEVFWLLKNCICYIFKYVNTLLERGGKND